jgi:hypothetical protein
MANRKYFTLKIVRDESPSDPLEDMDWATFAGWNRRYHIGNEQPQCEPQEYLEELQQEHGDKLIILPVYMHDHGFVSYSCADFNDRWDSGQVGFIWTTQERWQGSTDYEPPTVESLQNTLRSIVDEYSSWASGDAWGFIATEMEECSHCSEAKEVSDDSCWGFIGSNDDTKDNIREHLSDDVKGLLDDAWRARFS